MSITTKKVPAPASEPVQPWYRVPFVWFVILLMLVTVVACVHLVVVSFNVDDPSVLEQEHERVFKVPAVSDRAEGEKATAGDRSGHEP